MKPASDRILTTPSELGDVLSPLVTGNEWVALPDISPSDAGVGSMNIVHMASRGLVEWVGEFDSWKGLQVRGDMSEPRSWATSSGPGLPGGFLWAGAGFALRTAMSALPGSPYAPL